MHYVSQVEAKIRPVGGAQHGLFPLSLPQPQPPSIVLLLFLAPFICHNSGINNSKILRWGGTFSFSASGRAREALLKSTDDMEVFSAKQAWLSGGPAPRKWGHTGLPDFSNGKVVFLSKSKNHSSFKRRMLSPIWPSRQGLKS